MNNQNKLKKMHKNNNGNEEAVQLIPFADSGEWMHQVKSLYHDAFPEYERKPFSIIEKGIDQGKMKGWTAVKNGKFAGLAFVILGKELNVLDYLAVDPELRSQGIGAQILRKLSEILEYPFAVEIESTHADPSVDNCRRRRFYQENGMKDCGCEIELFGVPMELLATKRISFSEYCQVMTDYFERDISEYIRLLHTVSQNKESA